MQMIKKKGDHKVKLKLITVLLVISILSAAVYCEEPEGKLEINETFFGTVYKLDGKALSLSKVEKHIEPNPEAVQIYRKGKPYYYSGMICAGVGGFLIGYPIGRAMSSDEDMNWAVLGAGIGTSAVGVFLSAVADKKFKNGVTLYNNQLK